MAEIGRLSVLFVLVTHSSIGLMNSVVQPDVHHQSHNVRNATSNDHTPAWDQHIPAAGTQGLLSHLIRRGRCLLG